MAAKVFIDGSHGTTGLQLYERLRKEPSLELLSLEGEKRKDKKARAEYLNEADLSVLCLPDEAARDAVALIKNPKARLLDASNAHRTAKGWVYGMPEWSKEQPQRIAQAARVSNPGCYALASIALLRPLIAGGMMPKDYPIILSAISGYTGGGKEMIDRYENPKNPNFSQRPAQAYALALDHKHLEEIRLHSGLARAPIFMPWIGNYRQGMIVQMPLYLDTLTGKPRAENIYDALCAFYDHETHIRVMPLQSGSADARMDADRFQGRDDMHLLLFHHEARKQMILCAILDNLGKGAAGTAVQNIQLMISSKV